MVPYKLQVERLTDRIRGKRAQSSGSRTRGYRQRTRRSGRGIRWCHATDDHDRDRDCDHDHERDCDRDHARAGHRSVRRGVGSMSPKDGGEPRPSARTKLKRDIIH